MKSEVKRRSSKGRNISSEGYTRVEKLPRVAEQGVSYWIESPNGRHEFTHQFFRFPAKFHPPIVRWALGNYGRKGSVVFDPFTGSGTVQLEALVRDISSVGVDIDPLACLIARTKTTPLNPVILQGYLTEIRGALEPYVQARSAQAISPGSDITEEQYTQEVAGLAVPGILNIFHWFRKYVIVDLARILYVIGQLNLTVQELQFFRACVGAIIRRVSNADPDPVSGLEVTCVQAERNVTRIIRTFDNFFAKTQQAIQGMSELWRVYSTKGLQSVAHVVNGDMLNLAKVLRDDPLAQDGFPLVITSPPYCRSVEYSRRHQLEMYWLGLVNNQAEHVSLTHTYIGRKLVRISDWDGKLDFGIKSLDDTLLRIAEHDADRARTVKHYFYSMGKVFSELKQSMKREGTIVCVIGNSVCCNVSIPTADFIVEIAAENFKLTKRFSYALRNHNMQYGLWNGDGIKQEHVLVMKPK